MDVLLTVIAVIAGAIIVSVVAERRGRDKGSWFLLALLLSWPLTLAYVLLTPRRTEPTYY